MPTFNLRTPRPWLDRLTVTFGCLLLLGFVGGSWLPRSCPLVRGWLVGCPVAVPSHSTPNEAELNRIGHKDILTSEVLIQVPTQLPRDRSRVNFLYRAEDPAQRAYLQLRLPSGLKNVALIVDPLLKDLSWPHLSDTRWTVYARNGDPVAAELFVQNLPAHGVSSDKVAARDLHLADGSYVPLEGLKDLSTIDYVLTSYQQPQKDGTWDSFSYVTDASAAEPDSSNSLTWVIYLEPTPPAKLPFRLSTVDVNYLHGSQR